MNDSAPSLPIHGGKVLLIDGSPDFRARFQTYMQAQGLETFTAKGFDDSLALITGLNPNIAIVDLDLSHLNALHLLKDLKGMGLFCIATSVRASLAERVRALSSGADDFLHKPVELEELFWRIKNILAFRQIAKSSAVSQIIDFSGIKVDILSRTLINPEGRAGASLTDTEIALFRVLTEAMGQIVTKDELAEAYSGRRHEAAGRGLDVAISRLRLKIKASNLGVELRSVRNVGFILMKNRRKTYPITELA